VMLPRCIVVRWSWHARRDVPDDQLLPEKVRAGLADVRARWPSAPEPGAWFLERLAAAPTRACELFLAWWAGSGDGAGIAAFEAELGPDIDRLVARFHALPADELRQRLRIKLFVGTHASGPKIRDYTGAGALASWVRVTAARTFVDAVREDVQRRAEVELDESGVLGLAVPAVHDEAQRAQLAAAIKHAFAEAVSRLAPRERTFLRHATVDTLTLDQIASTYQVHRATVVRTRKAARERLLAETRAGVVARLGIAPEQLTSVLAMLDSRLELSLSAVLRRTATLTG
jgi:RNA polymerase sigma-70 factor, ECF subfamily